MRQATRAWSKARTRPEHSGLPESPYQGLLPYTEDDARFFFGRETERRLLIANLRATRLTLVYGDSGVGKSSLLRAGVVHDLREASRRHAARHSSPESLVVYFSEWSGDPLAGLSARIRTALAEAFGEQPEDPEPPVTLPRLLEAWTSQRQVDLLLVLDQFEEYFAYRQGEDGEGSFAVQFSNAVNRHDLPVSFLLAIREDALAKLDRFEGHIPDLFDNYLRVEHLNRGAARSAIERPLEELNRLRPEQEHVSIEDELVEAVLEGVQVGKVALDTVGRGGLQPDLGPGEGRVEAAHLQMVMTRLWTEEQRAGSRRLQAATLAKVGGAEKIVRTHLDEALDELAPGEQETAAGVFHQLVTPSGSKIGHTARDLASYTNLPPDEVSVVLQRLSDARILRTVAPTRGQGGEQRYEIFHDVLAPAVLDWRARYRTRRELEAERARRDRLRRVAVGALAVLMLFALAGVGVIIRNTKAAEESARQGQQQASQQAAAANANAKRATAQARSAAKKAYIASVNAACAKGDAEVERLGSMPPLKDPSGVATWLRSVVTIREDALASLQGPSVPPDDATVVNDIRLDYLLTLTAYQEAIEAFASGDADRGAATLDATGALRSDYEQRTRAYGLRDCAMALALG